MGLRVAANHAGVHRAHAEPILTACRKDLPLRVWEHAEVELREAERSNPAASQRNRRRAFIEPHGAQIRIHALGEGTFHRQPRPDDGVTAVVGDVHERLARGGVEFEHHAQRRSRRPLPFELCHLLLQTGDETPRPNGRAP